MTYWFKCASFRALKEFFISVGIVLYELCSCVGSHCKSCWKFIFLDFVSTVGSATSCSLWSSLTFDLLSLSLFLLCHTITPLISPSCPFSHLIPSRLSLLHSQMSGGPVDMDPLTQLLPGLRGPSGAKQGSEDPTTPGGGPQLHSPAPQTPAQLQSPMSLPQLQSPSPQLHSPSPQLKLQSPTQLQPGEAGTPRNVNVKREPPGTPNRGTVLTQHTYNL